MRVLIVKLWAMGDVVMSLPMIPALRSAHPDAQITWLAGRGSKSLLELIAGIDRIVTVDEVRLLQMGALARFREIASAWRKLMGERFDLVITAHPDWRYRVLTLPLRAALKRGFGRTGRAGPIPGRYHGNEYVRLALGKDGPDALAYDLPRISGQLPAPPFERRKGETIIAMAPGGARNALRDDPLRRWPPEMYAQAAKAEVAKGRRVIIVGGKGDADVSRFFAGIPVIDLVGRTSVPELVSALRAADVVLTHDSLALHLARLVRTPVVAIFGPTSPYEKIPAAALRQIDPAEHGVIALWGGESLPCRPCYDGVNYSACPVNECMRTISPELALAAVDRALIARNA